MRLTELVLQGVRRFSAPRKIAFQPGLNVVLGGQSSGKTTILEVLLELFFPKDPKLARNEFCSKPPGPASRAGVSFQIGDALYRKVEDFLQGGQALSRFNPETNAFELLVQDAPGIARFFAETCKLTVPEVYRTLCCAVPDEFPSQRVSSASLSSGLSQQEEDPQQMARQLQQLKQLYEDALKIKELQFELDGLHKEIFELLDVQKKVTVIQGKVNETKKELENFGRLPELPDDLDARSDAYKKATKKHNAELPQLQSEIHELQTQEQFAQPQPIAKDAAFIGCAVGTVIPIIAVAVAVGRTEMLGMPIGTFRLAMFGAALLCFGIAAMRVIRFLQETDRYQALVTDIKRRTEKLKSIERKYEVETSVVRNLLKSLDADSVEEMDTKILKIRALQGEVAQQEESLKKVRSRPDVQKAENELPNLKKRAAAMEQDLQSLSAAPVDADVLEAEIQELTAKLERSGSGFSVANSSQYLRSFRPEFVEKIGKDIFQHPTHRVVATAALALQVPLNEFIEKLLPPLDKNLGAFSFKNLTDPKIGSDGAVSVIEAPGNARARFEQLEPFKQDLVYFALKFTILQFLLREQQQPVLFDSAFSGFDERFHGVLVKALKFLSQQSQVLVMTSRDVYTQGADHVVKLDG